MEAVVEPVELVVVELAEVAVLHYVQDVHLDVLVDVLVDVVVVAAVVLHVHLGVEILVVAAV